MTPNARTYWKRQKNIFLISYLTVRQPTPSLWRSDSTASPDNSQRSQLKRQLHGFRWQHREENQQENYALTRQKGKIRQREALRFVKIFVKSVFNDLRFRGSNTLFLSLGDKRTWFPHFKTMSLNGNFLWYNVKC